jgi:hypothetical protein
MVLLCCTAGGHINGVARIKLGIDSRWQWVNFNLLGDDLFQNETIVPRIQIDPDNGDHNAGKAATTLDMHVH